MSFFKKEKAKSIFTLINLPSVCITSLRKLLFNHLSFQQVSWSNYKFLLFSITFQFFICTFNSFFISLSYSGCSLTHIKHLNKFMIHSLYLIIHLVSKYINYVRITFYFQYLLFWKFLSNSMFPSLTRLSHSNCSLNWQPLARRWFPAAWWEHMPTRSARPVHLATADTSLKYSCANLYFCRWKDIDFERKITLRISRYLLINEKKKKSTLPKLNLHLSRIIAY